MEGSMDNLAIIQALQNITSFPRKSSSVTDGQTPLLESSTSRVSLPNGRPENNAQPYFARPRSVDGSPSQGFSFSKARPVSFNTKFGRTTVPNLLTASEIKDDTHGSPKTQDPDIGLAEAARQIRENASDQDNASRLTLSIEGHESPQEEIDNGYSLNAVALDGPTLIGTHTSSSRASMQSPSKASNTARKSHGTDSEISTTASLRKVRSTSKIRKRSQRPTERQTSYPDSHASVIHDDSPLDPTRLLSALNAHYQKQKEQRDKVKASQRAKDLEIKDLEEISKTLHQQLQASETRVASQSSELRRYRELMPQWQEKVKKLRDFIKGLSNDHTRLRIEVHSLEENQRELQASKGSMNGELKEIVKAFQEERFQHKERLLKAYKDAESLQKASTNHNVELITSYHENVLAKMTQQEATLGAKMSDMREQVLHCISGQSTGNLDSLRTTLQECLLLFQQPREVAPSLDAETLHDLTTSVKEVSDLSEDIVDLSASLRSGIASLSRTISSSIENGHSTSEQVADLREAKATILERLRATEANLVDSRLRMNASTDRETLRLQEIAALKAEMEALRKEPRESPLQTLKLHEVEKENAEAAERLSECQAQLEAKQRALEEKQEEAMEIQRSFEKAQADLEDIRGQMQTLQSEKEAVEAQSLIREGATRTELSQACENEISRNANKSLNEIQMLRHQVSVAEKDIEDQHRLVEQLRTENTASRGRIQVHENSLASTGQRLRELEARNKELTAKVVVEDSHDRGAQRCNPATIEDPGSSPLSDHLAPSPVTDGRVMFPPSPLVTKSRSSFVTTVRKQDHKRRRLSSEQVDLGPVQESPIKAPGTTRRKSSLRQTKKNDKYVERFHQELRNPEIEPQEL
ncbi:MAG: hypothetical protein Q9203_002278 [Teloschistes exilis]